MSFCNSNTNQSYGGDGPGDTNAITQYFCDYLSNASAELNKTMFCDYSYSDGSYR